MISFDTNILVYAVDEETGSRHHRAVDLIERAIRAGSCIQPLQTLSEFFHVATRRIGLDPATAAAFVQGWQAVIPVEAAALPDLADAMRVVRQYQLSFWDAMLWATARRIGVRILMSEDFQDGQVIEGVRIVNPFAAHNAAFLREELDRPN